MFFNKHRDKLPSFTIVKSTSATHRNGTGNTRLINSTERTGGFLLICTTNVFEAGITVEDGDIVMATGYNFRDYYMPLLGEDVVIPSIPTKSSLIQQIGRAGRKNPGVSLILMQEETYEKLWTNIGAITTNNIDYIVLNMALSNPKNLREMLFPNVDPVNLQSLLDSMLSLFMWRMIDSKFKITQLGRTIMEIFTARLTVRESISVVLAMQYNFPIQLVVLINLYLSWSKTKGRVPSMDGLGSLESFRIIFEKAINTYGGFGFYIEEIEKTYVDILSRIDNLGLVLTSEKEIIENIKLHKESLYKKAKSIYSTVYFEYILTYSERDSAYILPNNIKFKLDQLRKHHLGRDFKTPTEGSHLLATGLNKIKIPNKHIIIPVAVAVLNL